MGDALTCTHADPPLAVAGPVVTAAAVINP